MLKLNVVKFQALQGSTPEAKMAEKLGISRTQLWRAKTGQPVGETFISAFKKAFPSKPFEKYFFYK